MCTVLEGEGVMGNHMSLWVIYVRKSEVIQATWSQKTLNKAQRQSIFGLLVSS